MCGNGWNKRKTALSLLIPHYTILKRTNPTAIFSFSASPEAPAKGAGEAKRAGACRAQRGKATTTTNLTTGLALPLTVLGAEERGAKHGEGGETSQSTDVTCNRRIRPQERKVLNSSGYRLLPKGPLLYPCTVTHLSATGGLTM